MVKQFSPTSKFKQAAERNEWEPLPDGGAPIEPLPHGVMLGKTGLILSHRLKAEEWEAVGSVLARLETAYQWAIGDWWAYGYHEYRSKKAAAIAAKLPYEPESLMNLGTVARQIPPSRRNEAVSYSHHVVVAPLEADEQTRFLKKAEINRWSVKKLREAVAGRAGDASPPVNEALYRLIGVATRARPAVITWRIENDLDVLINEVSATAKYWNDTVEELRQYRDEREANEVTYQQAAE